MLTLPFFSCRHWLKGRIYVLKTEKKLFLIEGQVFLRCSRSSDMNGKKSKVTFLDLERTFFDSCFQNPCQQSSLSGVFFFVINDKKQNFILQADRKKKQPRSKLG